MKKITLFSIIIFFAAGTILAQSASLTVTVSNVVNASQCTTPCNGSATGSASGGTAPYTYAWQPSGGNAATASTLCPGTYTVYAVDGTFNYGSNTVTITCTTNGVNNLPTTEENITLFPNPAHNELYVSIETHLHGKIDFSIRNILGSVVYQESIDTNGYLYKWVDISALPIGLYDIEFMNGTEIIRKKFVKQ